MRSSSSSSASLMPVLILDPQVAGGAGADAAAGVIEKDAEVLRHVEKRHRLAVMLVGHGAELELHRPALGKKGDAHQFVGGNVFLGCFAHRIPSFPARWRIGRRYLRAYLNSAAAIGMRRGHRLVQLLAGRVHGLAAQGGRYGGIHHQLGKPRVALSSASVALRMATISRTGPDLSQPVLRRGDGRLLLAGQLPPCRALRRAVDLSTESSPPHCAPRSAAAWQSPPRRGRRSPESCSRPARRSTRRSA